MGWEERKGLAMEKELKGVNVIGELTINQSCRLR